MAASTAKIDGWVARTRVAPSAIPQGELHPTTTHPTTPSCEQLIRTPNDAVPFRAPLALYTSLLEQVRGKSVVVIGESSTDGIACLGHTAASVSAALIEESEDDCLHLSTRASMAKNTSSRAAFSVVCDGDPLDRQRRGHGSARDSARLPDADVYVWRQASWRLIQPMLWLVRGVKPSACRAQFGARCGRGAPDSPEASYDPSKPPLNHIDSFDVIDVLRAEQAAGRIRTSATFASVFDDYTDHDRWTLHQLSALGYATWNASYCVNQAEMATCLRHGVAAGSRSAYHICARPHTDRYWLASGFVAAASLPPSVPDSSSSISSAKWNATAEADQLRRDGRATLYSGLTVALFPDGALVSGRAADAALDRQLRRAQRSNKATTTAGSSSPSPSAFEGARAGLFFQHTYRQVASEFASASTFMSWSAGHPMLRSASLLIVSTNAAMPTKSLTRWLGWYAAAFTGGLRMLLHTPRNLGYGCGEFHSLAASVNVWRRFPWVVAFSGPDVLALPGEYGLLSRLIDQSLAPDSPTALLYDRFRPSLNDPQSMRGEPRYNMDLFVFFPPKWLVGAKEDDLGVNGWATAAAHCVKQTRNRPEAVLHVVQQERNLSVRVIGNGSRGSLYDVAKFTRAVPDAFVWHVHKMPNVLSYVEGNAEKPRSMACAKAEGPPQINASESEPNP